MRPLSKGGMALVYEARRESLAGVSPRVAIKLILPEHQNSETFRELFINEARLGAAMQHQNLVQIQDFDCESDRYYLVMEYVEGFTLRRIITACQRHRLQIPPEVVAEIGRQACEGLHHAHSALDERGRHLKLVHRDVKPSNLILNPQGVVKVLDFGISKGRLREEREGAVKGTWGYMSPEQARGADVQPSTDVFGVATVLYELAALAPMFPEQNKTRIKELLHDDHARRMVSTMQAPYIQLAAVLRPALAVDPRDRVSTAEGFARQLARLSPDAVSARDSVQRFYERIEALERGQAAPVSQASQAATADAGAQSQGTVAPAPAEPAVVAGLFFSGFAASAAGALALVAAVLLVVFGGRWVQVESGAVSPLAPGTPVGLSLDEPAGPAGVGAPGEQRPPPQQRHAVGQGGPAMPSPQERLPDVATVKVVRPETLQVGPVGGAPEPVVAPVPVAELEPATLVVGAREAAEVYVGGKYVGASPIKQQLPPGHYAISIVAADGRRRSFELDLVEGEKVKKIWDFQKMTWR